MSLARSPGAATLRASARAICAAAFLALAACGRQGGEPLLLGLAVPLTEVDDRGDHEPGRQTPEVIRGYLENVGQDGGPPAFEGVAGRVAFDSNGDPVNKQFTLGVIQGGRIVLPRGAR